MSFGCAGIFVVQGIDEVGIDVDIRVGNRRLGQAQGRNQDIDQGIIGKMGRGITRHITILHHIAINVAIRHTLSILDIIPFAGNAAGPATLHLDKICRLVLSSIWRHASYPVGKCATDSMTAFPPFPEHPSLPAILKPFRARFPAPF